MVKIPKEQRRYCPYCDEHTDQTLKEPTNQKDSPMSKKFRKRQRKIDHGYGSFPYENPAHRSRGGKNPTSEGKDLSSSHVKRMWQELQEKEKKIQSSKTGDRKVIIMARQFLKIRCSECGNEQKIFSHASTEVDCLVCRTL